MKPENTENQWGNPSTWKTAVWACQFCDIDGDFWESVILSRLKVAKVSKDQRESDCKRSKWWGFPTEFWKFPVCPSNYLPFFRFLLLIFLVRCFQHVQFRQRYFFFYNGKSTRCSLCFKIFKTSSSNLS